MNPPEGVLEELQVYARLLDRPVLNAATIRSEIGEPISLAALPEREEKEPEIQFVEL